MNEAVARLGWDNRWAGVLAAAAVADGRDVVRVVSEHRGAYQVAGEGGTGWAELTGRKFRAARDKRDLPTVGDWLIVERWAAARAGNGAAVIDFVLPRRSLLVRRAAGERAVPQPIAANVDVAVIVTSANGELTPRRLERYLAMVREGGARPIIALSKLALAADEAAARAEVVAVADGAELIGICAPTGQGIAALRDSLAVGTGVLLGSSGVGKSTLLNALLGADLAATSALSIDDQRGRHTTTTRSMFPLPDGGVLIDTPGMRELGAWADGDEPAALDAPTAAIAAIAATCRFSDCRHGDEPGCAVRAAVAAGQLDPARLEHARALATERRTDGARAVAQRRQADKRGAKIQQQAKRDVLARKDRK